MTVPKIVPPRHSYCSQSWSVSLFSDCASHLNKVVDALSSSRPVKVEQLSDTLHYTACMVVARPVIVPAFDPADVSWRPRFVTDLEIVTWDLREDECLANQIAIYFACSLSRLSKALQAAGPQPLRSAGDFLEAALLRMLLCQGCRRDGRGLSVVPMDRALWMLGFLRNAGAAAGWAGQAGQRYKAAMVQFQSHPERWWRPEGLSAVYGRTRHCPMALTDLCVRRSGLMWGTATDQGTLSGLGSSA